MKNKKKVAEYGSKCKYVPHVAGELHNILSRISSAAVNTQAYRERYNRSKILSDTPFTIGTNVSIDTLCEQNPYKSHIIRTTANQFVRGTNFPALEVQAHSFDVETLTNKGIVNALIEVLFSLLDIDDVHRKEKYISSIFGDSYSRPTIATRQGKNGKVIKKMVFEMLDPRYIVFDPTAKTVTGENWVDELKWFAYCREYSRDDIVGRFGKWILDYITTGSMISSINTGRELDDYENGGVGRLYTQDDYDYYDVVEYHNKVDMVSILFVGGNAFPVMMHGDLDRDSVKENIQDFDEIEKYMDWQDDYMYFDASGEPLLMLDNKFMYWNPHGIRNWGVADLLARPQLMHEMMNNMMFDSARRQMDSVAWISGIPTRQFKSMMDDFYRERRKTYRAILNIPGGQAENINSGQISYGGVNPDLANGMQKQMYELSRHATGVAADQGEVRADSVGQESILEEERALSMEAISQDNIPNYRRQIENLIYFAVAHKGAAMDKVKVSFTEYRMPSAQELEMRTMATGEAPKFEIEEIPITITLPEALERIKDFEFNIHIDKTNMVSRMKSMNVENLSKALALLPPSLVPEAMKKALTALMRNLGVTDILPSDLDGIEEQMDPNGGMSQFQRPPGRPDEINDQAALMQLEQPKLPSPEVYAGQQIPF